MELERHPQLFRGESKVPGKAGRPWGRAGSLVPSAVPAGRPRSSVLTTFPGFSASNWAELPRDRDGIEEKPHRLLRPARPGATGTSHS